MEPNARFCGVCGYRLQANRPAATPPAGAPQARANVVRAQTPPAGVKPAPAGTVQKSPQPRPQMKKLGKGDEVYIGQTLNNRFKIESKIGEGGFGAVYRGVQLATG